MADVLDVLTLEEARAALSRSRVDAADSTLLALYITSVSRFLDDTVGPIVQRAVTELHDGGRPDIRPRQTPVAAVTSLTEYTYTTPTVLSAESNTSKPAVGYLLETDGRHGVRLIRRATGSDTWFPAGRRNVSLVYTAGRAATTALVDVKFKQAAQLILTHEWRAEKGAGTDTFGALGTGIPSFAMPNAAKEQLHHEYLPPGIA